jgi:anti-sigma B factor antagonist
MNPPVPSASYFTLAADEEAVVASFHRTQLTDEDNVEQLGQDLFALVEKDNHRQVILNLSMVRFVTSAVLGKWITLHRKLVRSDGVLVLCNLQDGVREILEASRLLTYFQTAATVDDARLLLKA